MLTTLWGRDSCAWFAKAEPDFVRSEVTPLTQSWLLAVLRTKIKLLNVTVPLCLTVFVPCNAIPCHSGFPQIHQTSFG